MKNLTFVTGNQSKADYFAKYLGLPVAHHKVDLDELQSLDLRQIVEHKVCQAYELLRAPVIVEDISLEFTALGRLPGPFIKFFLQELELAEICALLDGKDRSAAARCVIGYADGERTELFEGDLLGAIAERPAGRGGFGWDAIFIPEGYAITRAELDEADDQKTYLRLRPLAELKHFLKSITSDRLKES